MNILVIGSGGREHCLIWALQKNKNISNIFCAGENAGIKKIAKCINIDGDNIESLVEFSKNNQIDLVVLGPEAPLVAGIADEMKKNNIMVFGPKKSAAMLEGSKIFAKDFFKKYNIPTGDADFFDNSKKAIKYIESKNPPFVIKADGLCAGKGVVIAKSRSDAIETIEKFIDEKIFKSAGEKIIIEEFLSGEEFSFISVVAGDVLIPLIIAQDYKKIGDGNVGANTGGMGSYAPVPFVDNKLKEYCIENILNKTLIALQKENIEYCGALYAGLIKTKQGIKILEYNCRFGDPETQAILPLLESDFLELINSAVHYELQNYKILWKNKVCITVVIASGGYPEKYEINKEIKGLDDIKDENVIVFHAGTKNIDNKIVTSGGRVVALSCIASNFIEAREKIYNEIKKIKFENMYYRKDIGAI